MAGDMQQTITRKLATRRSLLQRLPRRLRVFELRTLAGPTRRDRLQFFGDRRQCDGPRAEQTTPDEQRIPPCGAGLAANDCQTVRGGNSCMIACSASQPSPAVALPMVCDAVAGWNDQQPVRWVAAAPAPLLASSWLVSARKPSHGCVDSP